MKRLKLNVMIVLDVVYGSLMWLSAQRTFQVAREIRQTSSVATNNVKSSWGGHYGRPLPPVWHIQQ